MRRYSLTFVAFMGLLLGAGETFGISDPIQPTSLSQLEIKTGEVALVTVEINDEPDSVVMGTFRDRTIPFFKMNAEGRYGGLFGIDLADQLDQAELVVQAHGNPAVRPIKRYLVTVHPTSFGIQKLTLPQDRVDLDPATLKRVKKEKKQILENLSGETNEKLWKGPFIIPVKGKVAGTFGQRRVINGQSRNPHSGEDISAPEGTEIVASNDGIVNLTGDFFFSGKSIVIDHGLGLFTMYFHLSELLVKEGERIVKGQAIGRVGSTGRATGPHLHWGARLNGARVDPFSLVKISFTSPDN